MGNARFMAVGRSSLSARMSYMVVGDLLRYELIAATIKGEGFSILKM